MKKLSILILLLSLQLSAQQFYKINVQEVSLRLVLEDISSRYRIKVSYSPQIADQYVITRKITAQSEGDLLSAILNGLPFKIQLSNGIYLIIPSKTIQREQEFVRGNITNAKGEPLAYAHVQMVNANGAITNENGGFSLPIKSDSALLRVSYLGFKSVDRRIFRGTDPLTIQLEEDAETLEEVVLTSDYLKDNSPEPSTFRMNMSNISSLPSLGNIDVFKSVQLLPGVKATDETMSGLSVRGGLPEQNLVLMDGMTLYHLDHFFGIFSSFNPTTIRNVEVLKGGFGAQYGGRVSSVVNVSGKTGSQDKINGEIGINLISADGYLEGPLGARKKTTFTLGYRRSYMDIVQTRLFKDFINSIRRDAMGSIDNNIHNGLIINPNFTFYDLTAKVRHKFSPNSVLETTLYSSDDSYNGTFGNDQLGVQASSFQVSDQAEWANMAASTSWKKQVTSLWYMNVQLGISNFHTTSNYNNSETFSAQQFSTSVAPVYNDSTITYLSYNKSNSINDLSFKVSNELIINDNNFLEFGVELNNLSTDHQLQYYRFSQTSQSNSSTVSSFYLQHALLSRRLKSSLGFRYQIYELAKTEYMDPRLNISYQINPNWLIKGAWSKHHQFMNRLALTPYSNQDQYYWVMADNQTVPVMFGRHAIIGSSYLYKHWTLDIELYQKQNSGILESEYLVGGAPLTDELQVESLLLGRNVSQGADIFLKYRKNKLDTWLSYSLSKSENSFGVLNNGNPYPALQDQRHELNWVGMYSTRRWEFSAVFILGSGKPYTPPNDGVDQSLIPYDISRLNSQRLPNYHRLDLSVKNELPWKKMKGQLGLTLFNVYNHVNIRSRRYAIRYDFEVVNDQVVEEVQLVPIDTRLLGFTPNLFFRIKI